MGELGGWCLEKSGETKMYSIVQRARLVGGLRRKREGSARIFSAPLFSIKSESRKDKHSLGLGERKEDFKETPPPLSPFSPPDLDRRVASPALSGRGSRPSGRTSG